MIYETLLQEFLKHPRDIHTIPLTKKECKWFYVFTNNGSLYVEPAHDHIPKSAVKRRRLNDAECDKMLELHYKRLAGQTVSKEAQETTYSQVYWYGIFSELNL